MAEIPYDLLGLIMGILGVVGLLPLLWAPVRYQLPQHKIKQLDALLEESSTLLESAVEKGFVPHAEFIIETRNLLHILQGRTESLRIAAIDGLSGHIDRVYTNAKGIRWRIATVSEMERRKAAEEHRQLSPSQSDWDVSDTFSPLDLGSDITDHDASILRSHRNLWCRILPFLRARSNFDAFPKPATVATITIFAGSELDYVLIVAVLSYDILEVATLW
ncbi:hypothetical protein EUX98_g8620 [Antrodiella citrinella]|uniref:Uncharacterized protein n=1 Tax=Antrodiella citrinella TaxID=2447956 RepID=A0A4S4M4Y4_9APHY|nr:hypothetical protein EUX98_g8620 [Antrodiella citrinella]